MMLTPPDKNIITGSAATSDGVKNSFKEPKTIYQLSNLIAKKPPPLPFARIQKVIVTLAGRIHKQQELGHPEKCSLAKSSLKRMIRRVDGVRNRKDT